MKKQSILAISTIALGLSSAAFAEKNYDDRIYLSPYASAIKTDDDRQTGDFGYGLGLGLGKAISEDFNVELRAFWNSLDDEKSASGQSDSSWDQFGSTIDLQYHFNRNDLSPYAVIGAGIMDSRVDGTNDLGVIGEAGVGLAYKINDHVSLRSDVRWRYNDSLNKKLTSNGRDEYSDIILNVGFVIPLGSSDKTDTSDKANTSDITASDADGDGVIDSKDQCQNSKKGANVNKYGCVTGVTLTGVNFKLESSELNDGSKDILSDLAYQIGVGSNRDAIEVQGHSSSEGSESYNKLLSKQRSNTVVEYLKSKGVKNILTSKGYGEA
ncbi:MAG: OOP family OmpA-OmpF porin, partial [Lentimonas sp.]